MSMSELTLRIEFIEANGEVLGAHVNLDAATAMPTLAQLPLARMADVIVLTMAALREAYTVARATREQVAPPVSPGPVAHSERAEQNDGLAHFRRKAGKDN